MKMVHKSSGFTLVELLLVAAIVSYSLSVVLSTFRCSVVLNEASRNLTAATTHAEYVLENIKNTAFTSISTNITNGNWNLNSTAITSAGLTALNSESIVTTQSGSNPLTVTVTVSWNDLQGRSRTQAFQTCFTG